MTDREKDKALLVEQAAELYLLGLEIERERRLIEKYKKAPAVQPPGNGGGVCQACKICQKMGGNGRPSLAHESKAGAWVAGGS